MIFAVPLQGVKRKEGMRYRMHGLAMGIATAGQQKTAMYTVNVGMEN